MSGDVVTRDAQNFLLTKTEAVITNFRHYLKSASRMPQNSAATPLFLRISLRAANSFTRTFLSEHDVKSTVN